MPSERWAPIPGYRRAYLISDLGRVKSCERWVRARGDSLRRVPERILQARAGGCVILSDHRGQRQSHRVALLVLRTFGDAPKNAEPVKRDPSGGDALSNLDWRVPAMRGVMISPAQVAQYLAGGRIACLICGRPFVAVGHHVRLAHGITAREYKIRYGLPVSRGVAAETAREKWRAGVASSWEAGKLVPPTPPEEKSGALPAYTWDMPRIDPRFADRLIDALRAGHTITSACDQPGMPRWTWVHKRLQRDAALRQRFEAAVEALPFAQQARMKKLGARFAAAVASLNGQTSAAISKALGVSEEAVRRQIIRNRA